MVQQELVNELAIYLGIGGEVFIQSDIEEVEREMRDRFYLTPVLNVKRRELVSRKSPTCRY